MATRHIYKVIFQSRDQLYEIYAHKLSQSALFGFIEIEELTFGEGSKLLVDPGAEKLAREFEGVKRSYIPLHAVVRIDEVSREGTGKVTPVSGEGATVLPMYTPPKKGGA
ncbi:MAG: DUF1820 family protein [Gammaproteobacteria bacterium]